jgi:quercetin dioxygenase-like cupin family protein
MTMWSTPTESAARLLVSRGAVELWSWTLAPGDRPISDAHRPGSGELLTVTAGTVALDVGRHRVEVPTGDSARLDATLPHGYANLAAATATFTLVVLEPA